jgi:ABC-type transport system involved in Fe-S cluster assembly fused permease/ATPase subunit
VLFNVVPSLIDIVVAVAYLAARMQPWVALIVAGTVVSYVPLTLYITERRGRVSQSESWRWGWWGVCVCVRLVCVQAGVFWLR